MAEVSLRKGVILDTRFALQGCALTKKGGHDVLLPWEIQGAQYMICVGKKWAKIA